MKPRPLSLAFALTAILQLTTTVYAVPPLTSNLEWKGRIVVEFAEELEPIEVELASGIALIGNPGLDALARQYNVHYMEKLIPGSKKPEDPSIRDISRYYILEFPPEIDLHKVSEAYALNPNVITAEPYLVHRISDYISPEIHSFQTLDYTPNDPLFNEQWALAKVNAEMAYDYSSGSPDIVVGFVDQGLDTMHEDLMANLWINPGEDLNGNGIIDPEEWNGIDDDLNGYIDDFRGWNVWQNNYNLQDTYGKGAHRAGNISAVTDNGTGISSLGCKARIMNVRAGNGIYIYNGASGIYHCVVNGANLINTCWTSAYPSFYEQSVINYAWDLGTIIIASAGTEYPLEGVNLDLLGPPFPAGYDHVVAVASTDQYDWKANCSNWGSCIDVCAPGCNILSTWLRNRYFPVTGTSIAASLVSSLACLVWSANPTFSNEEVLQQIYCTCANIDSLNPDYAGLLGWGRIDAGAALAGLFHEVTLTPENPPIVIPAGGGSFDLTLTLTNTDSISHTIDYWCNLILPDSSLLGPVLGPVRVDLPGQSILDSACTQTISDTLPPGDYMLHACIGLYPTSICDRDTIIFQKLEGPGVMEPEPKQPLAFSLIHVYPNPFNPGAVLRFNLPKASLIRLTIYNLQGEAIADLAQGCLQAGNHEVAFDGSGLPSGIYLYHFNAESFTVCGKMVLLK